MNEHVLITGASSKLGKLISKILAKKKLQSFNSLL